VRYLILTFCILSSSQATLGDDGLDEETIEQLLRQPILTPEMPQQEVQAFVEKRIPSMPDVKTRDDWEAEASRIRQQVLARIVYRGEAAKWRDAKCKVEWLSTIDDGNGYRIRKLRFEALPGLWIPALLYEPTKLSGKVPVVMNVNGHDADGKAAKYKQIRCINQAKRGMIALNVEWLGMGQLRDSDYTHYKMNQLDLCGTSGLAPFYLSMKRGLDILLAHEHADATRVAVAGLSGGGWQTIFISSLDTRVTLANPVAGYSSFKTRVRHLKDLGDSEQTPNDLAVVADYTHLTALLAPRAALLTFNKTDSCCFESDYALPPLLEAAVPIYQLYNKPKKLVWHVNVDPGNHNFERDNREALYRMFRDHFYRADHTFDDSEFACENEIKSKDELDVLLPDGNETFHSLALRLSRTLPRNGELPRAKNETASWRRTMTSRLREVVRWSEYRCVENQHVKTQQNRMGVRHLRLKIGDAWTVPVVELTPVNVKATAIVVSDGGRTKMAKQIRLLLSSGNRVLAVDPFYFGESKIAERDFLFALLVATVGERPLGIQASQIAAIACWSREQKPEQPVSIVADGPRCSTFSLVAAAIAGDSINAVELHGAMASLRQVITDNGAVNQTPEMFCFGLLEQFDVLQLAALVAPRKVTFHDADERTTSQLSALTDWYHKIGSQHDPFPPSRETE
jgi:hypothetical protein